MNSGYSVYGLSTGIIKRGENITEKILAALPSNIKIEDGDILTIAESALATSENNIVKLSTVTPGSKAIRYAQKYHMDSAVAEIVLKESQEIIGGIPGFLLCIRNGLLLPNAGVDGSNAPDGYVTLLPKDPDNSAKTIRQTIFERTGCRIGVIIIDSRTHPMRFGCTAIAIGCCGFSAVVDERGKKDLFGKELKVTRRAVADSIASAAELVMGESNEGIPAVLLKNIGISMNEKIGIEQISADECLYMGSLRSHLKNTENG